MPKNQARLGSKTRPATPTEKPVDALPRGAAKQAGTSVIGLNLSTINGFLSNPDAMRLTEYERALTTDETIASAIDFTVLALAASLGEYIHPQPAIQRFVRENLNQMQGNFRQAISELATSALWAGFGLSEMVWTVDGSTLWLERLPNYHPATVHMSVDRNGYLREGGDPMIPGGQKPGIYQLSPVTGMGTYVPLPMKKICLITHRRRHGNYYGESVIRRVYKNWRYKDIALEMWAIALDRYGTPVIYAIVPRAETGHEVIDFRAEGGKRMEMLSDNAAFAISNIHANSGLVLEQPDPLNPVKIDSLTTGNNYGTSFENFISHLDRSIYRGLLIPQTIFNESRSGGINNTSRTHFEVFKQMIRALYMQFVEPFTEQVVGRLIRYNFNNADPGSFPLMPFDATQAEMMAAVFEKMTTMGYIDPSNLDDMNEVRSGIGLKPRDQIIVPSLDRVVKDQKREQDIKIEVAEIRAEAAVKVGEMRGDSTETITDKAHSHQKEMQKTQLAQDRVKSKQEHEAKLLQIQESGKTARMQAKYGGQTQTPQKLSLGVEPENLPTVVVVVIVDVNGRILVVRRASTETNRAREWEVPGGHLDPGEMLVTAAQREVMEETGLLVELVAGTGVTFDLRDGSGWGALVGARLIGSPDDMQLDLAEHDRFAWVWPEDLAGYAPVPPNFVENTCTVWQQIMGQPL